MNGKFVPWKEANVHVMTHAMHYGSSVFEGIRAYKNDIDSAVFRLKEHTERLFYSAKSIALEIPYTIEEVCQATVETLKMNKLEECYIRPLVYYGYGIMGLNPKNAPTDVMIAAWPWGKYLAHDMVDLKVSKYIRIHPKSTVCDAKIGGHYINSILAAIEIRGTHYHEGIFLDYEGYVAEGPGENFFMVKNGVIYTPCLGTILKGITRDTVITIAKDLGLSVVEKKIRLEEALESDEAFYTGTAAEISPIRSINDQLIAGTGNLGKMTETLKKLYHSIVRGKESKYESYLTRY